MVARFTPSPAAPCRPARPAVAEAEALARLRARHRPQPAARARALLRCMHSVVGRDGLERPPVLRAPAPRRETTTASVSLECRTFLVVYDIRAYVTIPSCTLLR
jgi:hypothetical protein